MVQLTAYLEASAVSKCIITDVSLCAVRYVAPGNVGCAENPGSELCGGVVGTGFVVGPLVVVAIRILAIRFALGNHAVMIIPSRRRCGVYQVKRMHRVDDEVARLIRTGQLVRSDGLNGQMRIEVDVHDGVRGVIPLVGVDECG